MPGLLHQSHAHGAGNALTLAAVCAAGLIIAVGASAPAGATTVAYKDGAATRLGSGVTTHAVAWRGPGGAVHARVVSVNLAARGTSINAVLANGKVYSADEQVMSMASRTHAIAGVNGDFFDMRGRGAPWGGISASGVALKSPSPPKDVSDGQFVVTTSGHAYIRPLVYSGIITHGSAHRAILALNTPGAASRGHLTLISSAMGGTTSLPRCVVAMLTKVHGRWIVQATHTRQLSIRRVRATELALTSCGAGGGWLAANLHAGYHVALAARMASRGVGSVSAHTFISGGRILVKAGRASHSGAGAGTQGRNPETLVGVSRDARTVRLIVVDGRSRASAGVTMAEASAFLIHEGCYTAMLMDGGDSSVMVAKPSARASMRVLNTPATYRTKHTVSGVTVYSGLRPVADGLFVYASQ